MLHSTRPGAPRLSVQVRRLAELDSLDLSRWRDLAERALDPNPFQEPEFILPLASGLVDAEPLRVLTVSRGDGGEWLAAGVFQECAPSLTRPLPHLRALSSAYSFLDQPLIDREQADAAMEAAFDYLSAQRNWHGFRVRTQRADGRQTALLDVIACARGVARFVDRVWNRPVLELDGLDPDSVLERCSKSRRKSLQRSRRWLSEQGRLEYRLVVPGADDVEPIEDFLRLEALGWKGKRGTALATRPADELFFREMTRGFAARGRLLMGELRLDGRVIASTCNLRAGRVAYAFKIGWDPEWSKGNPGHWSELDLISAIRREHPDIEVLDSCASEGSYTASLYGTTRPMSSAVYVWSRRAIALSLAREQIQRLKQRTLASTPAEAATVAAVGMDSGETE
ncbi:MAG: GNAT family N-acetyltransferase [Planctomyces sp.]|nr:GNAT family N-acetyltransferase [Planctomyces sp.]